MDESLPAWLLGSACSVVFFAYFFLLTTARL